jgi:predicted RNase H-like HicB family nuclease
MGASSSIAFQDLGVENVDRLAQPKSSGVIMTSQVVNLEVTASIPIDCDFWSEDDGWKGLCKSLSVTVRGSSFEDAKKNMAGELQLHIERILREHRKRSARRIA